MQINCHIIDIFILNMMRHSQEGFQEAMSGYYEAVASPDRKGACFMAVCRGKVSEGLDFCDGNGRAVIITGLPYPPSRDPRVMEKQKYLEDNRKTPQFKGLTGQQWYRLEATRAVNQVIRLEALIYVKFFN